MIPVTRSLTGRRQRSVGHRYPSGVRPARHGTPRVAVPLPVLAPGGRVFAGMDPSDPSTWVRPWNPVSGMIGRLNFNGAAMQGNTDTGGVYSNPASWNAMVGVRPARRPR